MRALSDVASMTGKEPVPQASGECDPSGLSPNACRFCSVKVQGCDSPHSTHKVSAIRPEPSSKTMARQGDRAGGHGWPSKPLHPATCCLGTAATGCAPRRTRRRRLLSRTWPGLQGGCIAKTLSTADSRLATPPLQKSMGDFLQARIDRGDIWEAGGRLRCRRRLGMHVYHLCPQLLLLAQVCRLRSLVKLRIGDANHTVTSDHRVEFCNVLASARRAHVPRSRAHRARG